MAARFDREVSAEGLMLTRRKFHLFVLSVGAIASSKGAGGQQDGMVIIRIRADDSVRAIIPPIAQRDLTIEPDQSEAAQAQGLLQLGSIPRVFWSIFRPDGLYTYPAIVHDYLYWAQNASKDQADKILQFGMEDIGVDRATIITIYEAVHLAEQSAWNQNARLKALGEKRILSVFPDDPRSRWVDWKKDLTHFQ
jgi:hypothetical protein